MRSNPPYTTTLLKQGLFSRLDTFGALESRLAKLGGGQEESVDSSSGHTEPDTEPLRPEDGLELFALAYLATRRLPRIGEIHPQETTPPHWRRRLTPPGRDQGVDGLFQTPWGEFGAFRVVWSADRAPLTARMLSPFLAEPLPGIRWRILITNSEEIPTRLKKTPHLMLINGADLDRLSRAELRAIHGWLQSGSLLSSTAPPTAPQQARAAAELLQQIDCTSRLTALTASGTNTARIVFEFLERFGGGPGGRTVLLVTPNRSRMRHMALTWERSSVRSAIAALAICIDPPPSNKSDLLVTLASETTLPVSSDTDSIPPFLSWRFHGVRVLLTSYRTLPMLAEFFIKKQITLDLALFDHAEMLVGREKRKLMPLLDGEEGMRVRRMLFLTASTHAMDPLRRDRQGEAKVRWSLEN
ncbi:MAG: hypothetical protein HQL53_10700, partial [Magnetococcales bacterium]|nr:hypothetical protein [Magnetococcales bacterium]